MSPPYARFQKLDPERRQLILNAALDEFAARGFEGASLNRIVAGADISKGSFYYYFEDKIDLFVTVIEQFTDMNALLRDARVLEANDPAQFWRAIDRMVELSLRLLDTNPRLILLGNAITGLGPEAMSGPRMARFFQESQTVIGALMTRGQEVGALRTDLPLDLMIQLWLSTRQTLSAWAAQVWSTSDPVEDLETRDQVVRVMTDAFCRLFSV